MNRFFTIRFPHFVRFFCYFFVFYVSAAFSLRAATFEEYQLKAAFLYNFPHFISWPGQHFDGERRVFHYCVMGADLVESTLQKLISEQQDGNRWLHYKLDMVTDRFDDCHLLFIGKDIKHRRIGDIVHQLDDKAVLTVSDLHHFAYDNGMIELVRKENRVAVVVNMNAISEKGFSVSSKLLRFATVVKSNNKGGSKP